MVYLSGIPNPKAGSCPAVPPGVGGICVQECSSDYDCAQWDYKCCSNGCGMTCQMPMSKYICTHIIPLLAAHNTQKIYVKFSQSKSSSLPIRSNKLSCFFFIDADNPTQPPATSSPPLVSTFPLKNSTLLMVLQKIKVISITSGKS